MKSTLRRIRLLEARTPVLDLETLHWDIDEDAVRQLSDRDLEGLIGAVEQIVNAPEQRLSAAHRTALTHWQMATGCLKPRATSPSSRRFRFFVNTVTSQTGSSRFMPTNHRNNTL